MNDELVGNALCLDFANSVNQRTEPRHDWLAEPDGLRRWAVLAGLPRPSKRPDNATVIAAVELRDAVYRVFSAVAAGERARAADLSVITGMYADGLHAAVLVHGAADDARKTAAVMGDRTAARQGGAETAKAGLGGTVYEIDWSCGDPRRVLWAVADSAVELLRHGPLDRVGECPSCGWVFLDTSRNGRRRWCSMAMCGNAVKYARHQARTGR